LRGENQINPKSPISNPKSLQLNQPFNRST
jgi:hypothetical protein